ncbi:MAG: rlmB [Bacillales bacterium]|jgi:23S rRNA (guanosine2251-2'-O)-methyltransferase|nr:rlmB [Bacillales bacterium]
MKQSISVEKEMRMDNDLIMGRNSVLETLRTDRDIHKIWIQEGINKGQISSILNLANERKIVVQNVAKQRLDQMVQGNHQGIVAQVTAYQYAEVDDILAKAAGRNETPFLLILDELEDPHNLGSILRTSDAIGVHGVIIPKRRSVGLTTTVAKSSTGAIEHVPVARVTNLAQTIDQLKKQGLWIAGTDAAKSQDYRKLDGTLPLAIVIGSEGKGMSRIVKEKCDFLIHLPMVGHVTSLNASVAASLLMYEVYRQRNPL